MEWLGASGTSTCFISLIVLFEWGRHQYYYAHSADEGTEIQMEQVICSRTHNQKRLIWDLDLSKHKFFPQYQVGFRSPEVKYCGVKWC